MSSTGLASGLAAGEADITATYQNVAGRSHLTIVRPQAPTYTIRGTVTDGTFGGGRSNVHVETNSRGKITSTTTGSDGAYSIEGLPAGPATVTASDAGYDTTTKAVDISADLRVDFVLPRTPPCSYTIATAYYSNHIPANGGEFTLELVRTSGRCSWRAVQNVPWITLRDTAGDNSGTIRYSVSRGPDESFTRQGSITVTWQGGTAETSVTHDSICRYLSPLASASVPAAGGRTIISVTTNSSCGFEYSTDANWIGLGRTNTTVQVGVLPNTSTVSRTGVVHVTWPGGGTQQSIVQGAASP